MSDVTKPREHLVRALKADLVGPFCLDAEQGQDEVLDLPPSRWYLTGLLAPESGRDPEDPESNEELAAGSDEDEEETQGVEPDTKRKNMLLASIGVSVLLPEDSGSSITATVRFAEYARDKQEVEDADRPKEVWRRPRGLDSAHNSFVLGLAPELGFEP
jgi:hypothetical protein